MSKFGDIEVLFRPTQPCESTEARYAGLNPHSVTLPPGFRKRPNCRAFKTPTIFDRDIQIPLRDGVKLLADVFRPVDEPKVPALLVWSPYGKTGAGFFNLDLVPGRVGVASERLSGMEKFEGLDPAEWVPRGYAIVNVDTRGIFDSGGNMAWFGTQEGRDGYDTIEYIASLPWCTGKVAMVGNSWLAMSQWFIAAERPPHLSCIAPWEGASDFYRETLCRGGVPYKPFWGFLSNSMFGRNQQEDVLAMLERYPFMNEYWADKRADISRIEVPAYVLASFSTGLHTAGSFRGYQEIPHERKWLRVHSTQEWHDLYKEENVIDLCHFLDRYTKGMDNGWENTPPVRLSILQFNRPAIVNYVFPSWPVPKTRHETFYVASGGQLVSRPAQMASYQSYQADVKALQIDRDSEELPFTHTFSKTTYLIGASKAVLYMSCPSHDDLDVFVQLRKASSDGRILQNINIPLEDLGLSDAKDVVPVNTNIYLGPSGILRASHRVIDQTLSRGNEIVYSHTAEKAQKVNPGDIVRLEIAILPSAIRFEAGEKLILKVAGHPLILAEFEPLRGRFVAENRGLHSVHFGAQYDSHVQIPLVEL